MNDTASDAQASTTWRAAWPLRPLPIEVVPPLASLAALAALFSMVLNQLVLPGLGSIHSPQFARLAQLARFAANLSVTAGLITLVSCVSWALLGRPRLSIQRQLFVFTSSVMLAQVSMQALLFDHAIGSRVQVGFAIAAANAIGMAAGSAAVSGTRNLLPRTVALLITTLAALNLLTAILEFNSDSQLDPWARAIGTYAKAGGEIAYLLLLLIAFPLLMPRGLRTRVLFARSIGFAVLALAFYAQVTAQRALRADYTLLVYSAQRVSLWVDRFPMLYALPFCLLLSATTTALLNGGSSRFQAAAGMLLIFSSGYATRAPGRLLSLAIGFLLLSRGLIAITEHAPFRSLAPPPPGASLRPPGASLRPPGASMPPPSE
jgi:hypothetical protein